MPHDAGYRPPVDSDLTRTVPAHHLTMIDDVSTDRGEETAFSLTLTWTVGAARAVLRPQPQRTRAQPYTR